MTEFPTILGYRAVLGGRLELALSCGCAVTMDPVASVAREPRVMIGQGWAGGCSHRPEYAVTRRIAPGRTNASRPRSRSTKATKSVTQADRIRAREWDIRRRGRPEVIRSDLL